MPDMRTRAAGATLAPIACGFGSILSYYDNTYYDNRYPKSRERYKESYDVKI